MDTANNYNLRIHHLNKFTDWMPKCVVVACQHLPDVKNGMHQSLPLNPVIQPSKFISVTSILIYPYIPILVLIKMDFVSQVVNY
jgi:hypothetical protein